MKIREYLIFISYIPSKLLSSFLYALSKTTSLQNLLPSDCITLFLIYNVSNYTETLNIVPELCKINWRKMIINNKSTYLCIEPIFNVYVYLNTHQGRVP